VLHRPRRDRNGADGMTDLTTARRGLFGLVAATALAGVVRPCVQASDAHGTDAELIWLHHDYKDAEAEIRRLEGRDPPTPDAAFVPLDARRWRALGTAGQINAQTWDGIKAKHGILSGDLSLLGIDLPEEDAHQRLAMSIIEDVFRLQDSVRE